MNELNTQVKKFKSRYVAKQSDAQGYIDYTTEENVVWEFLYQRQIQLLPDRACAEYIAGIEKLQLDAHAIPQVPDVNRALQQLTGWQVHPVAALISAREFFQLLANRKFPAATFIRSREEIDYVKEPDIFHELFGHCPMLTVQPFADFVENYARLALELGKSAWPFLLRLFWFTVEFGLVNTKVGVRAYGGGILSSKEETVYSVESTIPDRLPFDTVDVLRTPYRIDQLQPLYYCIDDFQKLYDVRQLDITYLLDKARNLGEFPPKFKVEQGNPNIYIGIC